MFAAERDNASDLRKATAHLLATHPRTARANIAGVEEARWTCDLPVEVYAVRKENTDPYSQPDAVGVMGQLENLSNSGFGMLLDDQLSARLVIIALLPPQEQDFDLLAEILWCDPCPDGRMRVGGRLLRACPWAHARRSTARRKKKRCLPRQRAEDALLATGGADSARRPFARGRFSALRRAGVLAAE